jgi:hypothetical protein
LTVTRDRGRGRRAAGPAPAGSRRTVAARSATATGGAGNGYLSLFQVRIEHGYYNESGGACPDFQVVPTPDCARLMARLGMVFKDFGTGFSVLVAEARAAAMIDYVRSRYSAGPDGEGYWTWLTFLLVPTNPGFVGITGLPITTSPTAQNLHLDNRATVDGNQGLVLSGTTGPGPQTLYPVTGPTLSVPTPHGRSASITDLSGAPVQAAATSNADVATFNLKNLPYGFYTVALTARTGKPIAAGGFAGTRLYVPAQPLSLAVLDLLLTRPTAGAGDPEAFPIPPMSSPPASGAAPDPAALQPVSLTLPFQPRGTYWLYYVVWQGRGALGADLAIGGTGTSFAKSNETLPNGDRAMLFTAAAPLPLQQRSSYRFSLSGHRQGADGSRDEIQVPWLPSAPAAPVWPAASGDPLSGNSEIYVYV